MGPQDNKIKNIEMMKKFFLLALMAADKKISKTVKKQLTPELEKLLK
jgi:hypothetical protein